MSESYSTTGMFATKYGEVSGIEAQKLQRICVNRVAIIQALRVEHVIPHLMAKNILTDDDKKAILSAKTTQNKVRTLIDILPKKGSLGDWYKHFQYALQNPDTKNKEVKKKYQIIIDFMDNTILPNREKSTPSPAESDLSLKLPKYERLPAIQSSQSMQIKSRQMSHVTFDVSGRDSQTGDSENHSIDVGPTYTGQQNSEQEQRRLLLREFFHKWIEPPQDFESLIPDPKDYINYLEKSEEENDQKQLGQELQALERIRNLEVVLVLNRRKKLPNGFEVSVSSAAEDFLSESNLFHLYIKYIEKLRIRYNLNIPLELCASFLNVIDTLNDASEEEGVTYIVKIGFGLFNLLCVSGMYYRAEQLMSKLVVYLASSVDIEAWMATYEAFVKLMKIRNLNVNLSEADAVYMAAQQVAEKIKLMSFGQDLLDESECFVGLSTIMRERGSIASSYRWAQEALKEVDIDNHEGIVDVLCNASLAYGNKLNVKKAEQLIVQAVRCAKHWFGTRSPQYIRALLEYCHYSNEFRQDAFGINVARNALELCDKIYGSVATIHKAECLRVLARALLVSQTYTDGEYHLHALGAWRAALDVLDGNHPRLAVYRYTLAQSLLWKATNEEESSNGLLVWAETEATGALAAFRTHWGEGSLKQTQAQALLGQIYTRMGRTAEAQSILQDNMAIHNIAFSKTSHYTQLAHATLGAFYKTTDQPIEALGHLQKVIDTIDCQGVYLPWVHVCFDTVIELLNAMDRKKDAEHYEETLVEWMRRNPKPSQPLTWAHLHTQPQGYEDFYNTINTWGTHLKAAKRGLEALQAKGHVQNQLKLD